MHQGSSDGAPDDDVVSVLVVSSAYGASEPDWAEVARGSRRHFRFEHALPLGLTPLQTLIESRAPPLLLIDAALCAELGGMAVRQLKAARPATRWVLLWERESGQWLPDILHSQSSGGICWAASPRERRRALNVVLDGELWFTRAMTARVNATLYSELHASAQREADTFDDSLGWQPLTPRESDVVALVRQGFSNDDVATRLGVSINTVKKHLSNAFAKRGWNRRRQSLA